MSVKLYIEGGGDGPSLDGLFREAWRAFFEAAGLVGRMPGVVRGKGRDQAFDMFVTAIRNPRPGVLPMLLVDSEDAVLAGHSAWQHVKARDNWDRPAGVTDRQAFLMVQVMETWLIADRELLRNYFGIELREAHLRAWPALEEVPSTRFSVRLIRQRRRVTRRTRRARSPTRFFDNLTRHEWKRLARTRRLFSIICELPEASKLDGPTEVGSALVRQQSVPPHS